MNGKIDTDGFLSIERAGVMKEQLCPYMNNEIKTYGGQTGRYISSTLQMRPCGDWCPLFDEPYSYKKFKDSNRVGYFIMWCVPICNSKSWDFTTLTDERSK